MEAANAAALPSFDTPRAIRTRDASRLRAYKDNLDFYEGAQWPSISTRYSRYNQQRRLTLNLTRTFITKSAAYVMDGVSLAVDAPDDTDAQQQSAAAAELALRQVGDQNGLDVVDFDNELSCSVFGDGAYKVTWDDEGAHVRVTTPDVRTLWAWRRVDDPLTLLRVAQRWDIDAGAATAIYDYAGSPRRKPVLIEDWTADTYTLWLDDKPVDRRPNPYGFVPYVLYPNIREPGHEWGVSDVAGMRDAAIDLNRIMTQMSLIAELSGNPIAVLENVTDSTDIGVQPGAVWELPEGAKAYVLDLLSKGGATALHDQAQLVRQFLHDLAETPRTAFGDNDAGLSGVALKVSLDPLTKKVQRKRLIRSRAMATRSAMVLQLLAQYAGLDHAAAAMPVRVVWGDVNPNDSSRDLADAVLAAGAGVRSRRGAMSDLGTPDPDTELERWLQENALIAVRPPPAAPQQQQRTTDAPR